MRAIERLRALGQQHTELCKATRYKPGEERTRLDGSVWRKPLDGGPLEMVRGPQGVSSYGPARPRKPESPSRLRTDGWSTTAVWGAGHQDWADDDPAAPWNEPIRWTRETNDGAQWYPSAYYDASRMPSVVVFRNPLGYRKNGMYQATWMVPPGTVSMTGLSRRQRVPDPHGPYFNNLRQVRQWLAEHWRLNHPTSGDALARSLREQDAARERERQQAEERQRWEREQEERNRFAAREAAAKEQRIAADRASGRWMSTSYDSPQHKLKPVQKQALREALAAEGLSIEDSWDVHERAVRKRSAVGGTWPAAYRYAAMVVKNLRDGVNTVGAHLARPQ